MNELEDYLGVKLISACPMNLGDYNNFKGWKIPENEDPTKLGYLVKYNPEYLFLGHQRKYLKKHIDQLLV